MSWNLFFYRPVGQPELIIEEVDPLFARLPRFTRIPSREEDPLARGEVAFHYQNPISNTAFDFTFLTPEEDAEEEPGRADFPYEETPLQLHLHFMQSPELAQEAMPIAAEVCQALHLLVLDPQSEQEIPLPPNVDALIRSYNSFNQTVQETVEHVQQRSRRYMTIALALLLSGVGLIVLMATGVLR